MSDLRELLNIDSVTEAGTVIGDLSITGDLDALSFTGDGTGLTGVVLNTSKGQVNGVATLDGAGILTLSQLPDIDHDALTNYVANEHIDWTGASAGTIHATNYTNTNTTYVSSDFTHDSLTGVTANEHIDWTGASAGTIDATNLPTLALTDVYSVVSQIAQLALTAQEGDVAIRTDESKSYIHNGGSAGTMADWSELQTPSDVVSSVNSQTGAVVLNTSHISENTNLYYTESRVNANANVAANTSARHTHSNSAVLNATTASFLTADETKLDYISITQAVDLDALETSVANNVSNNHTHSNKTILDNVTSAFTTADRTKVDYITVTQAVNLDTIESWGDWSGHTHTVSEVTDFNPAHYLKDTTDTFSGTLTLNSTPKIHIGGELSTGSAAGLQVVGFIRSGDIYIHEGGNTPVNGASGLPLSNSGSNLQWNGTNVSMSGHTHSYNPTIGTDTNVDTSGIQIVDTLTMTDGVITSHTKRNFPQATTSSDGYLSQTDWDTFNNKQASGSYAALNGSLAQDFSADTLTVDNSVILTGTGELRGNGQQLILNAGESNTVATGQTNEYVYINAESGLEINSHPNNWTGGWSGRNTVNICKTDGTSSFSGNITAPAFIGALTGNASTASSATKLTTARTIDINGDITATAVAFDGTSNITITAAVNNNSHTHDDSTINGLNASATTAGVFATARIPTLNQSTTGNAASATKLATARTIDITGDITATAVAFDGTSNIAISAAVVNDSHTHDARYYTETELTNHTKNLQLAEVEAPVHTVTDSSNVNKVEMVWNDSETSLDFNFV